MQLSPGVVTAIGGAGRYLRSGVPCELIQPSPPITACLRTAMAPVRRHAVIMLQQTCFGACKKKSEMRSRNWCTHIVYIYCGTEVGMLFTYWDGSRRRWPNGWGERENLRVEHTIQSKRKKHERRRRHSSSYRGFRPHTHPAAKVFWSLAQRRCVDSWPRRFCDEGSG